MGKLPSKLQYPGYETGEYSDIAMRALQETMTLVATYPWAEMDSSMGVNLTGPSVVIEGAKTNYLKIGLYYGNRFCLYLLKANGVYYVRITETLEEVLELLQGFFEGKPIEEFFSREYNVGIRKHFVTRDFIYRVTLLRIIFVIGPWVFIASPFFIVAIALLSVGEIFYSLFALFAWALLGGLSWPVYINHFIYSLGTFIKITNGQPGFEFGKWGSKNYYNKDDIKCISAYCWNGKRRRPPSWSNVELYEVEFKDGSKIRFSSLVLSTFIVGNKFNRPIRQIHRTFPFTWNI